MRRTFIIVLAVLLQTAAAAAAQQSAAASSPSSIVRGRVVDDAASSPIVRARISVVTGAADTAPVFTDAEGRFSAAVPAIGALRLRVTKSGFIARDVAAAVSAEFVDVVLTRSAVVTARVLADDGEPVAGSAARIRPVDAPASRTDTIEGTTDDLGEFRFAGLSPGRYAVSAGHHALSCALGASGTALAQCLRARTEQEIELRGGEESSILLTIPSPFGRAVARPPDSTLTAIVDASGVVSRFELGATTNVGMRSGGVRGRGPANGSPAQGITVVLSESLTAASGGRRSSASAVTDSEGRFAIARVPAGAFGLSVSRSGMLLTSSLVGSPNNNIIAIGDGEWLDGVDVSIVPHGVITGAVVDEVGEPMEGLVIRAFRARYVNGRIVLEAAPNVGARHTDDRGRYRLFGFVPGCTTSSPPCPLRRSSREVPRFTHRCRSSIQDARQRPKVDPIRVDAAAVVINVDMAFAPYRGGRITGRAQLSSGRPVSGTAVLAGSARSGGLSPEPRAAAIRNGQFEFAHVAPGEYVVQVMGARTWESSEEFGAGYVRLSGEEATPLAITTAPPSTLSGTIRLEGRGNGISPESFRMRTLPADPDLAPACRRRSRPCPSVSRSVPMAASRSPASSARAAWSRRRLRDGG